MPFNNDKLFLVIIYLPLKKTIIAYRKVSLHLVKAKHSFRLRESKENVQTEPNSFLNETCSKKIK